MNIKNNKTLMMETRIGINSVLGANIAELLSIFLADEFLLSLKTKNAHWNIEGYDFYEKHLLFEHSCEQTEAAEIRARKNPIFG